MAQDLPSVPRCDFTYNFDAETQILEEYPKKQAARESRLQALVAANEVDPNLVRKSTPTPTPPTGEESMNEVVRCLLRDEVRDSPEGLSTDQLCQRLHQKWGIQKSEQQIEGALSDLQKSSSFPVVQVGQKYVSQPDAKSLEDVRSDDKRPTSGEDLVCVLAELELSDEAKSRFPDNQDKKVEFLFGMHQLLSMGFEKEAAMEALQLFDNQTDRAVNYLLGNL
eukprot:Rmarinus@m.17035